MAMRYAMLRWGIMCGTIDPRKRPSSQNPSDGLTKCLVGAAFENARARLLGLVVPHPTLGEMASGAREDRDPPVSVESPD